MPSPASPASSAPLINEAYLNQIQSRLKPQEFEAYLLFEIHRLLWQHEQKQSRIKDLEMAGVCTQRLIETLRAQK